MKKRILLIIVVLMVSGLVMGACSPAPASTPTAETEDDHADEEDEHADEEDEHADEEDEHADEEDEHADEEDEHADEEEEHGSDEHTTGHDIPEDAANVENPVEASDESVSAGQELYATNCAVCHGEEGEGDGPGAAGLEPPPADLHADHVQVLSDGALFYVVSHGVEDTSMPAWDEALSEEERWNLVNYLRTFADE